MSQRTGPTCSLRIRHISLQISQQFPLLLSHTEHYFHSLHHVVMVSIHLPGVGIPAAGARMEYPWWEAASASRVLLVRVTVPANQRAGTDRLAESGYLLKHRRAGHASSGGWTARYLLLCSIKVATELAVELLAPGAICECRQLHWIQ